MGRPVESPWEVRWTPEASYRPSLFHGDRRVLRCLAPDTMLSVVEAAGLATSDLRHLLLWAAWLVVAMFCARNEYGENEISMRKACTARSILRPAPRQDFDFHAFWNGHGDTHAVVPYAAVAHLPTPPPEEVIGGFFDTTDCARDLEAFLASR